MLPPDTNDPNIIEFSPLSKTVGNLIMKQTQETQEIQNRHQKEIEDLLGNNYKKLSIEDFILIFNREFSIKKDLLKFYIEYLFKKSLQEDNPDGLKLCITFFYKDILDIEGIKIDYNTTLGEQEKEKIRNFAKHCDESTAYAIEHVFDWYKNESKIRETRNTVAKVVRDIRKKLSSEEVDGENMDLLSNVLQLQNTKLKDTTYKNITRRIIKYIITNRKSIILPNIDNKYINILKNINDSIKDLLPRKINFWIQLLIDYNKTFGEDQEFTKYIQERTQNFPQADIDSLEEDTREKGNKAGLNLKTTSHVTQEENEKSEEKRRKIMSFLEKKKINIQNPEQNDQDSLTYYPKFDMRPEETIYALNTRTLELFISDPDGEANIPGKYGGQKKGRKIGEEEIDNLLAQK